LPYESLLKQTAMLVLKVDVPQPRFDTSRISEDILLIDEIIRRLHASVLNYEPIQLAQLTIRYKLMSSFTALAFDFKAMGGGVRKSSPGMAMPVFEEWS
jgi:hypothetical protein